jgi:hypothetical protein
MKAHEVQQSFNAEAQSAQRAAEEMPIRCTSPEMQRLVAIRVAFAGKDFGCASGAPN